MKLIKSPTLARAHELAVKYILTEGEEMITENNETTLYTDCIAIEVKTPFDNLMVSSCSPFINDAFLSTYTKTLIEGYKDSKFSYDYHSRLFHYDGCIDQIDYIIKKLKDEPNSRRAIAITWRPESDETMPDCPCLQLVQCNIINNKLNMKVVFRSNDMLSALGPNMYALVYLQKHIADRLNIEVGTYTHISLIPHIYYVRDMASIVKFCKKGKEFKPNKTVCGLCNQCTQS